MVSQTKPPGLPTGIEAYNPMIMKDQCVILCLEWVAGRHHHMGDVWTGELPPVLPVRICD